MKQIFDAHQKWKLLLVDQREWDYERLSPFLVWRGDWNIGHDGRNYSDRKDIISIALGLGWVKLSLDKTILIR